MYAADAQHPNQRLEAKLSHIYTLRGGPAIDLTIRPPYRQLLERLGNPHLHLPPVIHVAGTNGKGSVIALCRAMLEAAGYRVHAYTSPHLVRFNERVVLAGEEIGDDALESLLDEVLAENDGAGLTFFEITTALALTAFARVPADFVLLETGLGGRLDCTNVVPAPAVTTITSISFDHMEFLGDSLAAIAAEKAGIMKAGRPCIVGPVDDAAAADMLVRHAAQTGAPLLRAGTAWHAARRDDGLVFGMGDGAPMTLPPPALTGPHQAGNAGIALAAMMQLRAQGHDIPDSALADGLRAAHWPARLQRLPDCGDAELWVDGGHNEGAARVLAAQAAQWQAEDGKALHLVVAMMQTKDAAAFLGPLIPFCASVTATEIPGEPQTRPAAELAAQARMLGAADVRAEPDITRILNAAGRTARQGRMLVCGSLYLAGAVLGRISAQKS